MNLGIYIPNFNNISQLAGLCTMINKSLQGGLIKDASLFYDSIGHMPIKLNCGLFNSTDIWNFRGKLITTTLDGTVSATNITNNSKIYYYYGWEQRPNVLDLIYALSKNINLICRDTEDDQYLKRVTGTNPLGISSNFENILSLIGDSNG